jgi:hypothetical protein
VLYVTCIDYVAARLAGLSHLLFCTCRSATCNPPPLFIRSCSLPHHTSQNQFLGLPVLLMPEEVTLAVEKGVEYALSIVAFYFPPVLLAPPLRVAYSMPYLPPPPLLALASAATYVYCSRLTFGKNFPLSHSVPRLAGRREESTHFL